MEIVNESLDTWLDILKPYQKKTIKTLLEKNDNDEEKVAQIWLSSAGPINTATFGGLASSSPNKNYFQCLKDELNKLICGNNTYLEEKKQILEKGNLINVCASSQIAIFLSPVIGVSVPILTPAIVLMLHVISKISVNAYCSMINNHSKNRNDC